MARATIVRGDVEVTGKVLIRGDLESADIKVTGKPRKLEERLAELEQRVADLEQGRA